MDHLWSVGDIVENEYEVVRILGGPSKSGMGIVYVLRNRTTGLVEAAKTYQSLIDTKTLEFRHRFEQEAAIWGRLAGHINIVEPRGVFEFVGLPFMMSEYIEDGDLSIAIRRGLFVDRLELICELGMQFCDGMTFALKHGIRAHRDIKPQNLLLQEGKTLKICDFGIASAMDGFSSHSDPRHSTLSSELSLVPTASGLTAGSPMYMAPEQIQDPNSVDHRADIYSFGLVLWELMTQRPPRNETCTLAPPLSNIRNGKMRSILEKCLRTIPRDRFQMFEELREALNVLYSTKTGKGYGKNSFGETRGINTNVIRELERLRIAGDSKGIEQFIQKCEQQLLMTPASYELRVAIGMAIGLIGKHSHSAVDHLRFALDLAGSKLRRAAVFCEIGLILYESRRLEEAVRAFTRAIECDGSFGEYHYYLGRTYYSKIDWLNAQRSFEEALRLNPDEEDAYVYLARALNHQEQQSRAVEILQSGNLRIPRSEQITQYLSQCLLWTAQTQEALTTLGVAIELSPECASLRYLKTVANLLEKNRDSAELELFNARYLDVGLAGRSTSGLFDRCLELAKNNKWEKCHQLVKEWLEMIVFQVDINPKRRFNALAIQDGRIPQTDADHTAPLF